jgi:hypothetical protein
MKKIKLTNGGHAIVDDEDFDFLNKITWTRTKNGYAARTIWKDGKDGKLLMHRVIMNTPKGKDTDHINMKKLDNRKQNLRICSRSENMHNTMPPKNNTSGVKNICFDKARNKWMVRSKYNGRVFHVGRFNTMREAKNSLMKFLNNVNITKTSQPNELNAI